jgi:hypothetical protein
MKIVVAVVASSVAYATIRYNVVKGVAWSQWPGWVLNKAAALSALVLLAIAVLRAGRAPDRAPLLAAASWLMLVHVALSLALLGPAAYPTLFSDGLPTLAASFSLLLGVVAAASAPRMLRPDSRTGSYPRAERIRIAFLALVVALHAGLLGFTGWATPGKWPGGLPPITLISFAIGLLAAVAGLARRRPDPGPNGH